MIVEKMWGYEEYLANEKTYTGKRLHIIPNMLSSIHCHLNKTETFVCEHNIVIINTHIIYEEYGNRIGIESNSHILKSNESFTIHPQTWHSFYSPVGGTLLEFSDRHEDNDVYRLIQSKKDTGLLLLGISVSIEDTDWEAFKTLRK